ncbi:hypothetical protein CEQ90_12400 [Lewinellaceae bacterium SD302]|nr:hypothetical protein CEQ90_12400 [Lewinellaceae bacterium SD302]
MLAPIILRKSDSQAVAPEKKQTYTLVLTNASDADWLINLRGREDTKIAVSGYADDSPESVLQRIPWLLQPGVDTLIYDPNLAGPEIKDSIINLLNTSSPTTVFRKLSIK